MKTKLSTEQIVRLLNSSCDIEGYQELSWRDFLRLMLRELIYQGQDFKGISLTGDGEWYWKLMDAIALINPSLRKPDTIILSKGGHLDQILDYVFEPAKGSERFTPSEWLRARGKTIILSINASSTGSIEDQVVSAEIGNVILSRDSRSVHLYFASPVYLEGNYRETLKGQVYIKQIEVDIESSRVKNANGQSESFDEYFNHEVYGDLLEIH